MSAVEFFLPYRLAVKPTNVGAPGAKLYMYIPGTTTKRPMFTTNALTTQHPNPLTADGAGRWQVVYLDNSLTYKYVVKDKNGTILDTMDPYIPGVAPDSTSLQPYQDAAEAAADAAADSASDAAASAVDAAGSAADAAASAASVEGSKGDPGGNIMAVGAFTDIAGLTILSGTDRIYTTGYRASGRGGGALDRWQAPLAALPSTPVGANAWWTTSADGAQWFVSPDQRVSFEMFGAYGDCVVNTSRVVTGGNDDLPAWLGMMDFLNWSGRTSLIFGLRKATVPIYFGPFNYYFSATLDVQIGNVNFIGANPPNANAADGGTDFFFAGGVHGIRVQTDSTTGEGSGTDYQYLSSVGSHFKFIHCHGQSGGSAADGWRLRGVCVLYYCGATNFTRHGIGINVNAVGSGALRGNANCTNIIGGMYVRNGSVAYGGDGIHLEGADANAIFTLGVIVNDNFDFGINATEFLSSMHRDAHASGNGTPGAGAFYSTRVLAPGCTSGGNHYVVITGSETAAKTETPGTGSSWGLVETGTADANYPTFVSGTSIRAGGPYCGHGASNVATFDGCYAEGGQPAGQGDVRVMWRDCFLGSGISGGASNTVASHGLILGQSLSVPNLLQMSGAATDFLKLGNQSGAGVATPTYMDLGAGFVSTPGTNPKLRVYNDGSHIYGLGVSAGQMEYIVATGALHAFYIGGTRVGGWVPGALNLVEIASASVPNAVAGSQNLFIDTADHKLKRKDSAGTVVIIN